MNFIRVDGSEESIALRRQITNQMENPSGAMFTLHPSLLLAAVNKMLDLQKLDFSEFEKSQPKFGDQAKKATFGWGKFVPPPTAIIAQGKDGTLTTVADALAEETPDEKSRVWREEQYGPDGAKKLEAKLVRAYAKRTLSQVNPNPTLGNKDQWELRIHQLERELEKAYAEEWNVVAERVAGKVSKNEIHLLTDDNKVARFRRSDNEDDPDRNQFFDHFGGRTMEVGRPISIQHGNGPEHKPGDPCELCKSSMNAKTVRVERTPNPANDAVLELLRPQLHPEPVHDEMSVENGIVSKTTKTTGLIFDISRARAREVVQHKNGYTHAPGEPCLLCTSARTGKTLRVDGPVELGPRIPAAPPSSPQQSLRSEQAEKLLNAVHSKLDQYPDDEDVKEAMQAVLTMAGLE